MATTRKSLLARERTGCRRSPGRQRWAASPSQSVTPDGSTEAGYVLLAVIFMVALLVLSLAIAAPKVAAAIQRDREVELVHRGDQYKRAIRLYYKKFGRYPSSIDQLEKTNNIRFLRKRYLDPLTGKDDWKPVLVGQNHLCPLGFFGQPLGTGNTALAGATPIANSPNTSSFGSSSSFGSNSGASSGGFGSSSSSFGGSSGVGIGTGAVGSTTAGCVTAGAAGSPITASGTDGGSGNNAGGSGVGGGLGASSGGTSGGYASGNSSSSLGSGFGAGTSTSTTLGGSNPTGTGLGIATSTTLGGAPMMGVMPPQTKATILAYKLKNHYNEWEFDYFPVEDTMTAGGILGGGSNINGAGNTVNGPGSGIGTGTGTSGAFGGTGSAGSLGNPNQGSTTPQ